MPSFQCRVCGTSFNVGQGALDKYPGWKPKYCRDCSPKKGRRQPTQPARPRAKGRVVEDLLTLEEVLRKYSGGPQSGVFTDGSCSPNPGPGGWGVVWVQDGQIVEQLHGRHPDTTNNRMELEALIRGYDMLPEDADCDVFTDSQLCVRTINEWAAAWERNGWRRKGGAVKNLELVQELWALAQAHPRVRLRWIASHSGELWNEYADALATAWMRDRL